MTTLIENLYDDDADNKGVSAEIEGMVRHDLSTGAPGDPDNTGSPDDTGNTGDTGSNSTWGDVWGDSPRAEPETRNVRIGGERADEIPQPVSEPAVSSDQVTVVEEPEEPAEVPSLSMSRDELTAVQAEAENLRETVFALIEEVAEKEYRMVQAERKLSEIRMLVRPIVDPNQPTAMIADEVASEVLRIISGNRRR